MTEEVEEQIYLPPKLVDVFEAPRGSLRYRGAFGGRGSGKSFSFALMAAVWGYAEPLRILCTRDIQASIKQSFHAELKNAIRSYPWLAAHYDVGVDYLRGKNGTEFLFMGLRNSMGTIKSTAHIDLCIIEEAEAVPMSAYLDLEPTIRAPGSEIWPIWNPGAENSATDTLFRKNQPPRSRIVEMNYWDNPMFPPELEELRRHALTRFDPATYAHVWEGAYLRHSKAQIFANKYEIESFEPDEERWDGPYQGLDFGFSQDPTAAVRCWIHDESLYIEHETGKVGLEIDETKDFICDRIPMWEAYVTRADSARPESISYLRRHGMFRIEGVEKGKGSVEDGIEHIKSYKRIVIHPRCVETRREFGLYSYKVDRLSGDILSAIVDANNHYIDAIRYALEPIMKGSASSVWEKLA